MTARADDDDDFRLVAEPPPAGRMPRGSGRSRRNATRRWSWFGLLTRRPMRTIGGAIVSALLTSIVINALVLQKAKHPAPLFMPVQPPKAPAAQAPPAFAGQAHVPAAAPDNAPSEAKQSDTIAALLKPNGVQRPTTTAMPPTAKPKDAISAFLRSPTADKPRVERELAEAKSRDDIAALIKMNSPAVADAAEPSMETVASAQHALVKLGFVLRTDGTFGTATRQAIELFERDHGMPVDGELSPRVIKQLSELSGIAIR